MRSLSVSVLSVMAVLVAAANAGAQVMPCPQLRSEIAAGLDAKGVKNYILEIVGLMEINGRKVVGRCEAGTKAIIYGRRADLVDTAVDNPNGGYEVRVLGGPDAARTIASVGFLRELRKLCCDTPDTRTLSAFAKTLTLQDFPLRTDAPSLDYQLVENSGASFARNGMPAIFIVDSLAESDPVILEDHGHILGILPESHAGLRDVCGVASTEEGRKLSPSGYGSVRFEFDGKEYRARFVTTDLDWCKQRSDWVPPTNPELDRFKTQRERER